MLFNSNRVLEERNIIITATMMRFWRSLILLIAICAGWGYTGKADDGSDGYSFTFEDTSLIHALSELGQKTNLNISFNPDIIPDYQVSKSFEDERATHILFSLLDSHGLSTYLLPNGVFIIYKSLKRDLPNVPEVKFDRPEHGPLTGVIRAANGGSSVVFRSIGANSVAKTPDQNGSVTLSSFDSQQIIYITGSGVAPVRLSPERLDDDFEIVLEMLRPSEHPYPAIQ